MDQVAGVMWVRAKSKDWSQEDPSISSQLRLAKQTDPLNTPMLMAAYMEAVEKCPTATLKTRKKWRRILGF